jgi:hypothetical protein
MRLRGGWLGGDRFGGIVNHLPKSQQETGDMASQPGLYLTFLHIVRPAPENRTGREFLVFPAPDPNLTVYLGSSLLPN